MKEPYLPFSAEIIDAVCQPYDMCPVWKYGVETNGRLRYNSDALQALRRAIGVNDGERSLEDVKVKLLPVVDAILVYDKFDRTWLRVPSVDLYYTKDMTRAMHKMCADKIKKDYANSPLHEARVLARMWIDAQLEQLRNSPRFQDRKRAAKMKHPHPSSNPPVDREQNASSPAVNPAASPGAPAPDVTAVPAAPRPNDAARPHSPVPKPQPRPALRKIPNPMKPQSEKKP